MNNINNVEMLYFASVVLGLFMLGLLVFLGVQLR